MSHCLGIKSCALAFCLFVSATCMCQCSIKLDATDADASLPTINAVSASDTYITGKVITTGASPAPAVGTVQVCVNGANAGPAVTINLDGSFLAKPAATLSPGQNVIVQYQPAGKSPSLPAMLVVGAVAKPTCAAKFTTGSQTTVSMSIASASDGSFTYSGTVPNQTSGNVVVCINNQQPVTGPQIVAVGAAGAFSGSGLKLNSGDTLVAYYAAGAQTGPYTNSSSGPITISNSFNEIAPLGMVVAGLDISGASSTDPQAVFLGTGVIDFPVIHRTVGHLGETIDVPATPHNVWISGLVRIAGMAQPGTLSGNLGDLSSLGTYLGSAINATPDKIVQSIEINAAASFDLGSWYVDNVDSFSTGTFRKTFNRQYPKTLFAVSLIASGGAITPLSVSQANPPVYYLTNQIMQQFSLSPSGCSYSSSTPPCYVAFVPTDRTHFYRNYEAGLRLKMYAGDYSDLQPQYRFPGIADITIGQNEYVTGGKFHGAVLHLGGTLPVPQVDGLYIFGQMDLGMNFKSTQETAQLLLTPIPATANVTYLSPTVNLVPVSQPNRDRYRFGFGLDIYHLISAVKAKVASAAK